MNLHYVPILFQVKTRPEEIERVSEFLTVDEEGYGFIAIGWPGIGDLTGCNRDEIRRRLEEVYAYDNSYKLGYDLGVVNAFVNTMQTGAVVLVRDGETVWVGIVGPYRYVKSWDHRGGMPHQRRVQWVASLPRRELNAKVQSFIANRNVISQFPHEFEEADLERYLEDGEVAPVRRTRTGYSPETILKARSILEESLNSADPLIRVQAAAAILHQSRN